MAAMSRSRRGRFASVNCLGADSPKVGNAPNPDLAEPQIPDVECPGAEGNLRANIMNHAAKQLESALLL